jgi:hypothetical protein
MDFYQQGTKRVPVALNEAISLKHNLLKCLSDIPSKLQNFIPLNISQHRKTLWFAMWVQRIGYITYSFAL